MRLWVPKLPTMLHKWYHMRHLPLSLILKLRNPRLRPIPVSQTPLYHLQLPTLPDPNQMFNLRNRLLPKPLYIPMHIQQLLILRIIKLPTV